MSKNKNNRITSNSLEELPEQQILRLAAIVESSEDAIIGKTLDGIITSWNKGAEKIYGYTAKEMMGKSISILVPKDNPNEIPGILERLKKGEQIAHYETIRIKKNRQKINVSLTISLVKDKGGKIIGASTIARDITERKQAEREIVLLYHAIGSINECISITDQENTILYVNEAFLKTYGYERQELIGKNIGILGLAKDNSILLDEILSATLQGGWSGELINYKKNGTPFPISLSTSIIRDDLDRFEALVGIATDITERKQAEEELQKNHDRYRRAIAVANAVAYQKDYITDTYTFMGEGIKEMTGYTFQELTATIWNSILLETVMRGEAGGFSLNEAIRRTKNGEIKQWIAEQKIRTKNGEIRWIKDSSIQLYDSQGKAIGALGIMQDITERKQAEETLQRNHDRYRRAIVVANAVTYQKDYITDAYTYIGENIKEMTGYTPQEFTPALWNKILLKIIMRGEASGLSLEEARRRALTGELKHWKSDQKILTKSGEIRWLTDSSVELCDSQGMVIGSLGILQDITEQKQSEEKLLNRNQLAELGAEIGVILTRGESVREMLQKCSEVMVRYLDVAFARIWTLNSKENILELQASAGMYTHINGIHGRVPVGKYKIGLIAEEKKPHLTNAVIGDSRVSDQVWAKREGMVAFAGYPLLLENRLIGVMAMFAKHPLSDFNLSALASIADEVALGIERKLAEENKEIQLERITALRNIDMAISSSLDLKVTLNIILKEVVQQLKVDAADILLMNTHTCMLDFFACLGFSTPTIQQTHLRVGEGYAGKAVLERKLVCLPDINKDKADFARYSLLKEEKFVSFYCVPLIAKGNVKGVLEIFHRTLLNPNEEWIDYLNVLAGQAAIAIDNSELFNNLQHSNVELLLSYDTTIEGWSKALDLRDKETEGHTQRVTELTLQLARKMGIREEELIHIRRGALLHDIGKMGIPDNILLKPGKLTEEEWVIMKKHPIYAYELIYPISYLRPALEIPYYHHEKWDGSGYPNGLKREQIPLSARIFAIIDVWDALRSDRPYRKAWDKEKTLEHIKAGSGSHFDPKVVEVFLQIIS